MMIKHRLIEKMNDPFEQRLNSIRVDTWSDPLLIDYKAISCLMMCKKYTFSWKRG